jgi:hypothetical protein
MGYKFITKVTCLCLNYCALKLISFVSERRKEIVKLTMVGLYFFR